MTTAAVFVEGKGGRKAGSGDGNGPSVKETDTPRYKITNIIVMVLSKNDNTSKLSIFSCIAEHFLPPRTTQHYSST